MKDTSDVTLDIADKIKKPHLQAGCPDGRLVNDHTSCG